MEAWRKDMEAAPRDGREVWLYEPQYRDRNLGRWKDGSWWVGQRRHYASPTYWMPKEAFKPSFWRGLYPKVPQLYRL